MGNLGLAELLIIGVVALLVVGPKKLPEFAKALGEGFKSFKNAMKDHS